jgi:predicted permease
MMQPKNLTRDLRYGLRLFARAPGFTLLAVLTLGLGIGVNTAILSAIEAVFMSPLPYAGAERLVFLTASFPGNRHGGDNFSFLDFRDLQERARSFDAVAAHQDWMPVTLTGEDEPERLIANFVSQSYFDVFEGRTALGRSFAPEENRSPDARAVAVLADGFWRRRFGGDAGIVGRTILLNDTPIEIVGVMADGFRDLDETFRPQVDIWLPLGLTEIVLRQPALADRNYRVFYGVGKLREGVSRGEAQAELDAIAKTLAVSYPDTNEGYGLHVRSMRDHFLGSLYQPILLLALGSALTLLVACANVSSFLLGRVTGRASEFAVRAALGASRGTLVAQVLLECALLTVFGGLLGLLLGGWLLEAFVWWNPVALPSFVAIGLDPRVLAASVGLAAVTGLLAGLPPALASARGSLARQVGAGPGGRARALLVMGEVGLAMVLLAGAALTLRSFRNLTDTGVGYDSENLLTMRMDLRSQKYAEPESRIRFARSLLSAAESLPGARSAALWGPSDLGRGSWIMFVSAEGAPRARQEDLLMISRHGTNPGGLRSLGIDLLEGRDLTWQDDAGSPPVAIVSESLAKRLWPSESAIGKRFWWHARDGFLTVVGVAKDARHRHRFHPREGAIAFRPQYDAYLPYAQGPNAALVVALRTEGDPRALAQPLARAVLSIDPDLPVYDVTTLEERLAEEEGPSSAIAALMGSYAGLALLLSALGVYGALAHRVAARTREIGLRMALGAGRSDIVRMVLRDGMALVAAGVVLGLSLALALSRAIAGLLFGVSPTDPLSYALVGFLLLAVAALACGVPARRATRISPLEALRAER